MLYNKTNILEQARMDSPVKLFPCLQKFKFMNNHVEIQI